jgi:putative endonuclease
MESFFMNSLLRQLIFKIIYCRLWTRILDRYFVDDSLGFYGERLAARHLLKQGYYITAQQFRIRRGEIDLIAVDKNTIVFVEVKTRRRSLNSIPAEAVDEDKQNRLAQTSKHYLKLNNLTECQTRFDIIAIICSGPGAIASITHYKYAFEPRASFEIF